MPWTVDRELRGENGEGLERDLSTGSGLPGVRAAPTDLARYLTALEKPLAM